MLAETRHALVRFRGQIIGWGIGLFLYGLMMAFFYGTVQEMEGFMEIVEMYPEELVAFVGDITAINTPEGYMDVYYFSYMTIIVGVFAIAAGAGLVSGDEEKGVLDLVMAHPISRAGLFWGRVSSLAAATVLILLVGWFGWLIPAGSSGLDLSWSSLLLAFLPLFAELLLFASLALLLSLLLPSGRLAGLISGGLLVANFLLLGAANLNDKIEPIIKVTPLYYYQGGQAVNGLNWTWLAGLLGVTTILVLVAWWRFARRDIRVGGERGWQLPKLAGMLNRG